MTYQDLASFVYNTLLNWMDSHETIVGVVVGALIASISSFIIAWRNSKDLKKEREFELNKEILFKTEGRAQEVLIALHEYILIADMIENHIRKRIEIDEKRLEDNTKDVRFKMLTNVELYFTDFDLSKISKCGDLLNAMLAQYIKAHDLWFNNPSNYANGEKEEKYAEMVVDFNKIHSELFPIGVDLTEYLNLKIEELRKKAIS